MRIGLTGGIGSGKTTATDLLAELGATIVDADLIAREVVAVGSAGLDAIAAQFGDGVLRADGQLDREAMAALVFADPEARGRLNAIVHPLVRTRSAELARQAPPGAIVVHSIPLLVETGQQGSFDLVVVVDVPPETAVARLVAHRRMTEAEARARVAAQVDRAQRLAAADVVLDNSGGLEHLAVQVHELWAELQQRT